MFWTELNVKNKKPFRISLTIPVGILATTLLPYTTSQKALFLGLNSPLNRSALNQMERGAKALILSLS